MTPRLRAIRETSHFPMFMDPTNNLARCCFVTMIRNSDLPSFKHKKFSPGPYLRNTPFKLRNTPGRNDNYV